jgi:hypothetical protein
MKGKGREAARNTLKVHPGLDTFTAGSDQFQGILDQFSPFQAKPIQNGGPTRPTGLDQVHEFRAILTHSTAQIF